MTSSINIQRRVLMGAAWRWVNVVTDIPIDSNCVYVNELMSTEYVSLRWNSDVVINLQPGDAILYNDVRYRLGNPSIPTLTSKGGYNYQQTFYAEWTFWANKKVFYNRAIGVEAGWKMTQYPSYFLDLILGTIDNINWSYEIDGEFSEMKPCDFSSGTDIISMLNTMADDNHWRTEWWVDSKNCVLHFGSCIDEESDAIEIDDDYVISVNKSNTSSKNKVGRLYAFGGTNNISAYYRKSLIFKAGDAEAMATAQALATSLGYQHGIVDNTRKITSDVFLVSVNVSDSQNKGVKFNTLNSFSLTLIKQNNYLLEGLQTSDLVVNTQGEIAYITLKSGSISSYINVGENYRNKQYTISIAIDAVDGNGNRIGSTTMSKDFSVYYNQENTLSIGEFDSISIGRGNGNVYLKVRVTISSRVAIPNTYSLSVSNLIVDIDASGNVKKTSININGNTYDATCVQRGSDSLSNSVIMFNGDYTPQVGDEYTLNNIAEYLLPASYFTRLDNSVEKGVADNRLMLPQGIDYVELDDHTFDPYADTEGILVLDDIYPKMKLSVTNVTTKKYTEVDQETYIDKEWNAYLIKYEGMTFKERYILDDTELHIIFQDGDLCGMDFAVKFNPNGVSEDNANSQMLEIVRNTNYILPIPNDTMKPKIGDHFILYGFNTAYIDEGLVPSAEIELMSKAKEILIEARKDDANYECTMNPIRCMGYIGYLGTTSKADAGIYDLQLGRKVIYDSDIYGTIDSRIRRIERRLDDQSLKYTLGVSAPYSRLRELRTLIKNIK